MAELALYAIGRDRPGIVAGVSEVLVRHGVNIQDSQATILRGHFAMILVVEVPDGADRDRLAADLERAAERLGLERVHLDEVGREHGAPEPSHTVTVYGVDHPGIVHAAASALAERDIGITDLNTRLVEEEGEQALYALMMEVTIPPGADPAEVESALAAVAEREGVEVTLRELEQDAL